MSVKIELFLVKKENRQYIKDDSGRVWGAIDETSDGRYINVSEDADSSKIYNTLNEVVADICRRNVANFLPISNPQVVYPVGPNGS